jgi:3,4-dihydroxy 2-butanone 4-phosphate synthase/GTP cyclohydrolase II
VSQDAPSNLEPIAAPSPFADITDAIAAVARGEIVVVVDDEDRENEGDLIFAAEHATPETLAFVVRHSSGVVCVAM